MASRRFFGYDPYDYYYTAFPYRYPYPYYHHEQPAPVLTAGGFFPAATDDDRHYSYQHKPSTARSAGSFFPAAGNVDPRAAVRPKAGSSRSVSIPVRFVGSDADPEGFVRMPSVRRALPSAEAAALRVQAAARGFLARRAVRALRAVEREAEEVAGMVAREAQSLRGDGRARVAVGEQLMRLLLRLDAVRGARDYRRRVARRVLALQDAIDALEEQRPVAVAVAEEAEAEAAISTTSENAFVTELPGAVAKAGVTETAVAMEVDGDRSVAEDAESAPNGANHGGEEKADEDAEGEWEMVAEEPAAAAPVAPQSTERQEQAGEEVDRRPAEADGGVDAKKLMEMVAALCERSAQQCAVIGALAERMDALERAVRRVEDAERRRRRAKKLRKEGKGSNHSKCYSD